MKKDLSWDLSALYNSFEDPSFKNDFSNIKTLIKNFTVFINTQINILPPIKIIEEYLDFSIKFNNLLIKLMSYAELRLSTDTNDSEALKYLSVLRDIHSQSTEPVVKFQKFLSSLTDFENIFKENKQFKEFEFHLKELKEKSKYLLSDEEEILYSKLKQTGSNAFSILQDKATSNLMIEIELEEKKILPLSAIRNLAYDKDVNTRKKAYEAEMASYKKIEEVSAAALNSIKGEAITMAKKRGFESVLDMSLKNSRMDKKTLDTMLEAMKESLPYFTKYFKRKAKLTKDGKNLKFYNLFAPIGESELKFTYEEAKEFILKNFYEFSENLGNFAKKAFENNWIDPFPKEGKIGGAFCANLHPVKESRILANFDGTFNAMDTLAHELGHGYHGEVLSKVSVINSDYPMPLAETASIFCETLIFNAALKNADKNSKISILETSIMSSAQVIVDIYSRFLFESEFIEKRKEGLLSVNEIKDIMLKAQKTAYQDGLDENYLHPYMWACKPHYYNVDYNFYNYPYAFGLLFSLGLYALYIKDKENFLKIYDELLIRTGNSNVYDAVKFVGIDLHDINFWRESLKTVTDEIEEFLKLTEKP